MASEAQVGIDAAREALSKAQSACEALARTIEAIDASGNDAAHKARLVAHIKRVATALGSVALVVSSLEIEL